MYIPLTNTVPVDLPTAKGLAIEAMRIHGVFVEACRWSGIGRSILYRELRGDPEFRRAMAHAKRDCLEDLERAMLERGKYWRGDLAGIYYLKNNHPRYREVSRIELTGKDGGPLQYEAAKEELGRRLEKLHAALQESAQDAQLVGSRGLGKGSRGPGSEGSEGFAGSEGSGVSGSGRPQLVKADGPRVRKIQR